MVDAEEREADQFHAEGRILTFSLLASEELF
jgi:hypothetical protein